MVLCPAMTFSGLKVSLPHLALLSKTHRACPSNLRRPFGSTGERDGYVQDMKLAGTYRDVHPHLRMFSQPVQWGPFNQCKYDGY